jgi:hypothetical protein
MAPEDKTEMEKNFISKAEFEKGMSDLREKLRQEAQSAKNQFSITLAGIAVIFGVLSFFGINGMLTDGIKKGTEQALISSGFNTTLKDANDQRSAVDLDRTNADAALSSLETLRAKYASDINNSIKYGESVGVHWGADGGQILEIEQGLIPGANLAVTKPPRNVIQQTWVIMRK